MIREISAQQISHAVAQLFLKACVCPPKDVIDCLAQAKERESSPQGREIFRQLLENAQIAQQTQTPYCQDTGMAVVFMEIGQDVHITGGDLTQAVNQGVRTAYEQGYFRKSVLSPLDRINTKDNTPAIIHTEIVPGDQIHITASPKGFGSENMSQIKMLKPADGVQGIIDFVVQAAKTAGGSPCPPVILGVGIGGTFEKAAILSKKQLLRPVDSSNPDPQLAQLERDILEGINALKMGPMGLGGDHYCLAVHIASYPTHLASLPVAVNFCCHALRHEDITL